MRLDGPTQRTSRARNSRLLILGVSAACLLISFQNFSDIPLEMLKPNFASARDSAEQEALRGRGGDIRRFAPDKPADYDDTVTLAAPQSGSDLASIGQDWVQRQTRMLTGGAEDRMLMSVNKKMERLFRSEDSVSPSHSGNPIGSEADRNQDLNSKQARTNTPPSNDPSHAHEPFLKGLRFNTLTRVEMSLSDETHLTCAYEGGGMQVDLAKPLSNSVDINLRHRSNDKSSTVQLNYTW